MVEEILENLISQFTDPLTFYRELIQNALDAGSNAVHVDIAFREEPAAAVIEVYDFGEGMNRAIIEQELTRLFSSSKEEDFTKIGKFGIGFVSVFAINPQLVVVETGRDGESWRVVFDGSPVYRCLRLEAPVEGTRVRLYKAMARADFDQFVTRSLERVRFWCRYSDTPIYFRGTPINEKLTVDSPLVVHHRQPGTEVVLGLCPGQPPAYGMYTRGLTLMEGKESFWPGVAFRLKSRYLEHTLTRDNVLRDASYDKAIRILRKVAGHELPLAFFQRVGDLLASRDHAALEALFASAVLFLQAWRRTIPRSLRDLPLFPTLHGEALSLTGLRRAAAREGAVYAQERPNHVTQTLARVGVPVLACHPDSGMALAVASITGLPPRLASVAVAAPLACEDAAAMQALGRLVPTVEMLLADSRVAFRDIVVADFRYDGSSVVNRPFLLQSDEQEPVRLYRPNRWWQWGMTNRLLLNVSHPLVTAALSRAADAPLVSAYALARSVLAGYGLTDRMQARLLARSMASRPRAEDGWFTHLMALFSGRSLP